MEIVFFVLYFAIVVSQYYFVYDIWFKERIKRYWIPVAGCGLYALLISMGESRDSLFSLAMAYVFVILSVFFVQIRKNRIGLQRVLTITFIISCFEQMLLMFGKLILEESGMELPMFLLQIIINLFMLSAVIGIKLGMMKLYAGFGKRIKLFFSKHIMMLVIIMSFVMMITIVGLGYSREIIEGHMYRVVTGIIIGLANGSVVMLGFFSVYINKTNKKIEQLLESEIRLKELQKCYYESLLEKEEETKRFRHDTINHLISLEGMAEKGENDRIKNYIWEMRIKLETNKDNKYTMGNTVLDTLTNYYIGLLDKTVDVKICGKINAKPDEMKLCIIYGNLIQNAVEEVALCKEKAWIKILIEQGKDYFRIMIENSLSGTKQKSRIHDNNDYHGIGLENVKNTVEEMGGLIEIGEDSFGYKVTVSLPNKMTA